MNFVNIYALQNKCKCLIKKERKKKVSRELE